MKKFFTLIISIIIMTSVNVYAESCNEIIDSNFTNFTCNKVGVVKFYYESKDISNFFEVKNKETYSVISIVKSNGIPNLNGLVSSFPTNVEKPIIKMMIGNEVIGNLTVINTKYVKPTTVPTTTKPTEPTTTVPTTKPTLPTYTVTLDHNDNTNEKTTKTCSATSSSNSCTITLPKLEKENFNGWGTAKTCQEGSSGSIRVTENTTYYACYKNNTAEEKLPLLDSLKLYDEETNDELNYGIFSIKENTYKLTVENNVKNIKVDALAKENITIEILGNKELKDGKNEIVINLKDDKEKENSYVIEVTRLKEGETIDENHYLKNLTIGGYNLLFDKKTFVYNLTISKDINELIINYELEKESDQVEIKGNQNLVNGSIIVLEVSGDNETITKYIINITKEESTKDILIYGIIGGIFLILIILILIIFIKNDKNKKGENNNPKPKKEKKQKKQKGPAILPDAKEEIEILNF